MSSEVSVQQLNDISGTLVQSLQENAFLINQAATSFRRLAHRLVPDLEKTITYDLTIKRERNHTVSINELISLLKAHTHVTVG